MLDTQTVLMLIGLGAIAVVWLMILVRPLGRVSRYSRAPYGRQARSTAVGRNPREGSAPPSEQPPAPPKDHKTDVA